MKKASKLHLRKNVVAQLSKRMSAEELGLVAGGGFPQTEGACYTKLNCDSGVLQCTPTHLTHACTHYTINC